MADASAVRKQEFPSGGTLKGVIDHPKGHVSYQSPKPLDYWRKHRNSQVDRCGKTTLSSKATYHFKQNS